MGDIETWKVLVGSVTTIVVAAITYAGVRFTGRQAKAGTDSTIQVTAQQDALQAYKDLLAPYREEVAQVRTQLKATRDAGEAAMNQMRDQHANELRRVRRDIQKLHRELDEWQRLARVIARWAMKMRDQVLTLGGQVDATPDELLTLQALEDRGPIRRELTAELDRADDVEHDHDRDGRPDPPATAHHA